MPSCVPRVPQYRHQLPSERRACQMTCNGRMTFVPKRPLKLPEVAHLTRAGKLEGSLDCILLVHSHLQIERRCPTYPKAEQISNVVGSFRHPRMFGGQHLHAGPRPRYATRGAAIPPVEGDVVPLRSRHLVGAEHHRQRGFRNYRAGRASPGLAGPDCHQVDSSVGGGRLLERLDEATHLPNLMNMSRGQFIGSQDCCAISGSTESPALFDVAVFKKIDAVMAHENPPTRRA